MRKVGRRLGTAVRWFTLGSGPMKRGTDRVQQASRLIVLVFLLAAVPLSGWLSAQVHQRLAHDAVVQARARHHIRVTLVKDAVVSTAVGGPSVGSPPVASAPARWTDCHGRTRVGTVPAPAGASAGTTVAVWITADGNLVSAPLGARDVASASVAAGTGAFVGALLAALAGHALVCAFLARRRDRQWTDGWAAVAPVWRAQHR